MHISNRLRVISFRTLGLYSLTQVAAAIKVLFLCPHREGFLKQILKMYKR